MVRARPEERPGQARPDQTRPTSGTRARFRRTVSIDATGTRGSRTDFGTVPSIPGTKAHAREIAAATEGEGGKGGNRRPGAPRRPVLLPPLPVDSY